MNNKIATAALMALAGAVALGIYIAVAPIPDGIAASNSKEVERVRATVACDHSGAVSGYKAQCAEQPAAAAEGPETR
jgi:hypothetical protein